MFIIFGLGAFQSFVFSVLLLTKKENKQADKFLSAFFFVATLYFLNMYSFEYSIWRQCPDIMIIYTLIFLLYGPLLFFYVKSILGEKISLKQVIPHSIPIIAVLLIIMPFFFLEYDEKLLCFTDKFINLPLNISIGTFLQYLSSPIYFGWILIILKRHRQYLKNTYSYDEKINLNWMYILLIGGISIWMIECLNVIALNFTDLEFPLKWNTSYFIKLAFLIFIMFMGYYGINQGGIFSKVRPDELPNQTSKEKTKLIPKDSANEYIEKITNYIRSKEVYLNNDLRIQDLSTSLKIPVHIISNIINNELNQNFYDFINAYRIEEVKKRLHNPEYNNLTIIGIAFDCGFNSKATFNRLFKNHTGLTPSQYKKKVILWK